MCTEQNDQSINNEKSEDVLQVTIISQSNSSYFSIQDSTLMWHDSIILSSMQMICVDDREGRPLFTIINWHEPSLCHNILGVAAPSLLLVPTPLDVHCVHTNDSFLFLVVSAHLWRKRWTTPFPMCDLATATKTQPPVNTEIFPHTTH